MTHAMIAQRKRSAVFFVTGPLRAGTRFCARRNGSSADLEVLSEKSSAAKSSNSATEAAGPLRCGPARRSSSGVKRPSFLAINRFLENRQAQYNRLSHEFEQIFA